MGKRFPIPEEHWWVLAAVALAIISLLQIQRNRAEERQRLEQQQRQGVGKDIPGLRFLSIEGPDSDGYSYLKYCNTSRTETAIIKSMSLYVSDPDRLKAIKTYHPQLKVPFAPANVNKDVVTLVQSAWADPGYMFYVYPDLRIPPGKTVILETSIVDAALHGSFTGAWSIQLEEGRGDSRTITLRCVRNRDERRNRW